MTPNNILLIFIDQLSLEKFSLAVDGKIYRDPILDKGEKVRDPGTLIDKLDISIKSFPTC